MSIYELCARLIHVCDGTSLPPPEAMAKLGANAAIAFSLLTDSFEFIENDIERDPSKRLCAGFCAKF
ncbi:MAG: hypothetical protein ACLP4V_27955 [Methylocella sp.]